MVEELKVLEHFSTSDHNMVEFNFVLTTGCCNAVTYKYDFRKGDYNAIARTLKETDWGLTVSYTHLTLPTKRIV